MYIYNLMCQSIYSNGFYTPMKTSSMESIFKSGKKQNM